MLSAEAVNMALAIGLMMALDALAAEEQQQQVHAQPYQPTAPAPEAMRASYECTSVCLSGVGFGVAI